MACSTSQVPYRSGSSSLAAVSPLGRGGLRLRAGRVVRGLPPHGGTGGAAMTALKEVAGLYSACGVRDCPVAIVAAASQLKPTRLAMPVCHSECRAAGILSAGWHRRPLPGGRAPCLGRPWSRHGDGSVAGGAGSSPEGGAAAGGAFRGRGYPLHCSCWPAAGCGPAGGCCWPCRVRMITSRQAPLTCHVLISEQSATAGVRGDLEQSGAVIVDAAATTAAVASSMH